MINNRNFKILLTLIFVFQAGYSYLDCADEISSISINRQNIYDSLAARNFFLNSWLNELHVMTKEYVVEDELIFKGDEELNKFDIYETERLLRAMNIFSSVSVSASENEKASYDINVITKDRWSLEPSFLYGTGGGTYNIGGGLRDWNLLGTNTYLQMDALYRSENKIGWDGLLALTQRRLFRFPLSFAFMLESNKIRTDQYISLKQDYLNYRINDSYGADFYRAFGDIYYYNTSLGTERLPFRYLSGSAFYSHSWIEEDKLYFTVQTQFNKVTRGKDELRQAFDNTGNVLISFSSVADHYRPVEKIDTYLTQDLCTGGYGNAILGKIFSMGNGGENLYYLGAQGEQSLFVGDNLYLYGQVIGASGFTGGAKGKYTYLGVLGTGFYRFSPSLLFAARVKHQSVWNWTAKRQLILDNDAGLRGYEVNALTGDNRLVSNFELRFFPDWRIWILNLSGVVFMDIGSAWNQDTKIYNSKWHSSIGFGIRFHNMKSSAQNEVFRFDFAYNMSEGRIAKIIITTGQLFSLINPHKYKLPELFGREFDEF